jgi:hypothetical protein
VYLPLASPKAITAGVISAGPVRQEVLQDDVSREEPIDSRITPIW